jgi:hypothetical protein
MEPRVNPVRNAEPSREAMRRYAEGERTKAPT